MKASFKEEGFNSGPRQPLHLRTCNDNHDKIYLEISRSLILNTLLAISLKCRDHVELSSTLK